MATTANAPNDAKLPDELRRPLAVACKAAVLSPPEWMEIQHEQEKEGGGARGWWDVEGQKWLKDVCGLLKIDYGSLPTVPTGADIHPLPITGPESQLQLASALLSYTLFPPSSLTAVSKPIEKAAGSINYPAFQRAFVSRTLSFLLVPTHTLVEAEYAASLQLMREIEKAKKGMDEKSEEARKAQEEGWGGKWGRWAATGGGLIIGGVALGVTGGLAAPALLPFIPFLTAASAPIVLGTLFGLAGGGLTGYRVRNRWAGVEEFEFKQIMGGHDRDAPSLTATIFIPGIALETQDETIKISQSALPLFKPPRDVFHLVHSPQAMLNTGNGVRGFLTAKVLGKIKGELIKRTALNAVMGAISLPMSIYGTAGTIVDNAWVRGCDKARKAGDLLADVLREGVQGERPVILIGYSIGALTLFQALQNLSTPSRTSVPTASAPSNPIVDTAILISMPISPSTSEWARARQSVARRFVNAYSEHDLVLAGIGRLGEVMGGRVGWANMAGLKQVDREGVEDVDMKEILGGHFEIQDKLPQILTLVGLDR
ncbi:DUF726-domain-containing protein [Calocera viscosa TUFC12733]|uniref:DUF726-domain-containing protein n=1 Tax=Calocera viscosa (strain TUFC12733) TaxID=1330018 RepID=A0A167KIW4_CALVF|nr:DUF726-domain-containing protein [Calocera viscosa TUFC12733]